MPEQRIVAERARTDNKGFKTIVVVLNGLLLVLSLSRLHFLRAARKYSAHWLRNQLINRSIEVEYSAHREVVILILHLFACLCIRLSNSIKLTQSSRLSASSGIRHKVESPSLCMLIKRNRNRTRMGEKVSDLNERCTTNIRAATIEELTRSEC